MKIAGSEVVIDGGARRRKSCGLYIEIDYPRSNEKAGNSGSVFYLSVYGQNGNPAVYFRILSR